MLLVIDTYHPSTSQPLAEAILTCLHIAELSVSVLVLSARAGAVLLWLSMPSGPCCWLWLCWRHSTHHEISVRLRLCSSANEAALPVCCAVGDQGKFCNRPPPLPPWYFLHLREFCLSLAVREAWGAWLFTFTEHRERHGGADVS